ncbi:hypothetical protein FEDK69T_20560 [Flavobacterium enshiense DK69]|uniref:Secretion system C-terminal sorting domain-containing protein n=1 Tax=Flavobacterium enshiense DK69 TaxID=1107311 RepID=V6S600_9FLAO|nr:SBBP repeat-containing protein [Flavobacterium enshiense]ESU22081.1 hypothetical protein FEDK69T_20560 [Flavobacterium enshiense DK69]KGO97096.1 hypothetical protein Q767_00390 [Flavobacterium enshiense DK69]
MKKLCCFFWFFLMGIQFVVHAQDDPAFEWAFNTTGTPISGGESNGKEIVVDDFGKVFVLGYFESTADFDFSGNAYNLTSGSGSLFLAKYESNGTLIWAKKIAGTSFSINALPDSDQAFNLSLDSNGDLILSGAFYGTVDFDPGPAVVTVSPDGLSDIFISKFDSNGNFVWVKTMGGSGNSYAKIQSLFLDANNNIYIGGVFDTQADFNPGPGVNVLIAAEGLDGFFARYDSNGNYVWAKSIAGNQGNEYINSIAADSAGNVLIAGNFLYSCDFNPDAGINLLNSVEGSEDAFIAKYNSSGGYLWAKQIGGSANDDVNAVKLDSAGNIYITGVFSGTVDFDPNAGTVTHTSLGAGDVFIAKYNPSGFYLWSKPIGGAGYEEAFSLLLDNNAIYITGWFFGTSDFDPGAGTASLTSNGYNDVFWAKYDITGNYIWGKSLGGVNPSPGEHTSPVYEKGFSLAAGNNGQVFLTGVFFGTADFNPGPGIVNITSGQGYSNAFWGRFDSSGNYLNAVAIGGYGGESFQTGVCVEQGSDGDVYSAGYFYGSCDFDLGPNQSFLNAANSGSMFMAKYNDAGGYLWAKRLEGEGMALVSSMVLDQDENIYVSGTLSGEIDFDPGAGISILNGTEGDEIVSKLFLAKYDSDGKYLWAKAVGSSVISHSFALDPQRNVLVSGYFYGTGDFDPDAGTATLVSDGSSDAFIAKYDVNGHYVWAKRIDNSEQIMPNSVVCDNSGNFYCAGFFSGATDFDPGIPTVVYNSALNQAYNAFLVKYNPNGDFVWVKVPQGEAPIKAKSIAIDPTGNLIVAGTFGFGNINLNPGGSNGNLDGQEAANLYFAKYGSNGGFIWVKGASSQGSSVEANDVSTDALGNVYLTGYFMNRIDFDPNVQNQNILISSALTPDVFFAKYGNNGNFLWAKSIGGDGYDSGTSLSLKNNKLLLTGDFSGEGDFDATSGITALTCLNVNNMFLAKYSLCGNLNNTISLVGNTLTASAVADAYQWIDCNNGGAFINGATSQSFSPSVAGNYAVIITDNNCQVASECHSVLGVDNPGSLNGLVLYPNPTNGDFKIQFPHAFSEITSKITNILGETISVNRFFGEQQVSLSLAQVSEGLYFVEIDYDGYRQDFKVLKK